MSTATAPSGYAWMRVHLAVLFAVLALVAFIPATASAAPASTGTACGAQVLTTTTVTPAIHQQGPEHSVLVTHAIRHHVRSTVAQRRASRADTGAFTQLPEGLWPPACLTLVARWGRSTDRPLDRAVTIHPLRL
jgi:hypothetical protein